MTSKPPELQLPEPLGDDPIGIRRALVESELRLRTILNAASVVMWAVDRDGVFTFSEGRLLDKLGLEGGEVVGQSIYDVYGDQQQILEDNRRALTGEEFTSIATVGGITFEARYTPFRDNSGEVQGVIGFAVDVTERLEAEQRQDRMVSLLKATLESTNDGILVVDREGRIATFNRKFAEMWRLPADVVDSGDDERAIGEVLSQLKDPEGFVQRVNFLYEHPEETSFDVLHFKDGRTFERFSQPQKVDDEIVGRVWSFRDVSERVRAETALRRRERQLEHAQLLAGFGSWEWDAEEDRVMWSDQLYRIYGVKPDEVTPSLDTYLDLVHPEDRARADKAIQRALRDGSSFDFFERIVRADGEVRTLHSQGETLVNEEGRVVRIIAACDDVTERLEADLVVRRSRDELEALVRERTSELAQANFALEEEISERERAEEELRRSKAELEGIFHALPDLYLRLGRNGEILAQRSGGNATIGLPSGSYIGQPVRDLLPPGIREGFDRAFAKLAEDGEPAMVEFSFPMDGEERQFEARFLPHLDGEAVTIVRDITDRHRAEVALRQSEEHYRRLIENSSDVATILGPDGINRYQSPSVQYVLGHSAEDMIGTSAFERIHPDDAAQCTEALRFVASHPGETKSVEFRYRHGDGSWRMLEARARTLLPDSAAEGIVVNSRDVTERKLYEDALQEAKTEAEMANRAKSDFLSRMSHELRTPMNSILGFAQLLARKDIPPEFRRSVDHILKAGRHLLTLINEVLEISRIESGRQTLSVEPVGIGAVLQESASLIQPLANQRKIEIEEASVPDDLFVRADRQRLIQVLINLLANAVKYNREGGSIRIICESPTDHERVRIGIEDTGPGISEADLQRLFTPFERLSAEQTEVEGTGLGLALCKRLVEAMDGQVAVESRVGEGSTFWVELERAENPAGQFAGRSDDRRPETNGASDRPATILYIEDNLPNLALIETILEDRPEISLMSAVQGKMGVYLATENQPDLILLDLHLPDIPGETVLNELRSSPETRDIPIVVVSADATSAAIRKLLDAGAQAYLTKPLDVGEFLDIIDRFLTPSGADKN